MKFEFSTATFNMVQELVFPLLKGLIGFDAQAWVGEKSELFIHVGDSLGEISELFLIAGSALEDGVLTAEELDKIITQAGTVPDAIAEIIGYFKDDTEIPVVPTPPVTP